MNGRRRLDMRLRTLISASERHTRPDFDIKKPKFAIFLSRGPGEQPEVYVFAISCVYRTTFTSECKSPQTLRSVLDWKRKGYS